MLELSLRVSINIIRTRLLRIIVGTGSIARLEFSVSGPITTY